MNLFDMNYTNTGYTVELRELVNSGINVWDFEYPSYYKGEAKSAFEQKVLDHYWFRQIGQETPARWLHYFRSRIREIMPYYIQLYESVDIMKAIEDPFESYNLTETFTQETEKQDTLTSERSGTGTLSEERSGTGSLSEERTDSGTSSGTVKTNTTEDLRFTGGSSNTTDKDLSNQRIHSDTPQGTITNIESHMSEATLVSDHVGETVEVTESGTHDNLTQVDTTNTGTTSGTGTVEQATTSADTMEQTRTDSENTNQTNAGTGKVSHTLTRKGNIGVQPLGKEMEALRESFLNVDMLVINELKDLFIQIY